MIKYQIMGKKDTMSFSGAYLYLCALGALATAGVSLLETCSGNKKPTAPAGIEQKVNEPQASPKDKQPLTSSFSYQFSQPVHYK